VLEFQNGGCVARSLFENEALLLVVKKGKYKSFFFNQLLLLTFFFPISKLKCIIKDVVFPTFALLYYVRDKIFKWENL
jgi:hypothetical protein